MSKNMTIFPSLVEQTLEKMDAVVEPIVAVRQARDMMQCIEECKANFPISNSNAQKVCLFGCFHRKRMLVDTPEYA